MQRDDFPQFVALLGDVMGLYPQAKPLADGQVAMFFRALSAYPLQHVRAGIDGHVKDPQRGRFPPLPADVIAQIDGLVANDTRPGAEEAWAMALHSADEARTVVWTEEMAQAWEIARPVMAIGDKVGARVAFREAYARLIDDARKNRRPAGWVVSLGHDQQQRRQAIEAAVDAGWLPRSELQALPAPTPPGGVLQLAIEGPDADQSPAAIEGRRVLRELADRLRARGEALDTTERDRMQALKRAADLAAREYAASQGMELDGTPLPGRGDRDAA
jgi:hypothetical protein